MWLFLGIFVSLQNKMWFLPDGLQWLPIKQQLQTTGGCASRDMATSNFQLKEWPSVYQSQHMTIFSYHYNTFSLSLVDWQVFVWLSTKMEVLFMLKSVRPIIFFLWKWEAVSLNNTFCCWDLSDMLLPVSREVAKQKLLQKFTTKLHRSTVAQTAAVTEVIDVLQCKQWPLFLVFYFQYNLYFSRRTGENGTKVQNPAQRTTLT